MVKVLVVEDSPVVREFLLHILGSDPEIEVVDSGNRRRSARSSGTDQTRHYYHGRPHAEDERI